MSTNNPQNNTKSESTHAAFITTKYFHTGNFSSISMLTVDHRHVSEVTQGLSRIASHHQLDGYGRHLSRGKSEESRLGIDLTTYAVQLAVSGYVRLDVLSWNTLNNLRTYGVVEGSAIERQQIYSSLLSSVCSSGWASGFTWDVYLNTIAVKDWYLIAKDGLGKIKTPSVEVDTMASQAFVDVLGKKLRINHVHKNVQRSQPLIQLSDLFAGLSGYSRNNPEKYEYWRQVQKDDLASTVSLVSLDLSQHDLVQCSIIDHLLSTCAKVGLSVKHIATKGLRTVTAGESINFVWADMIK